MSSGNDARTTQTLGRYRLLKRVGRGGMGEVWLAEDPRLNRQVAVKMLPAHNQENQEFSQRFEREAQAAAALNHPHILPVHDFGEQTLPNGSILTYIVMPYIAGGSLADKIEYYRSSNTAMPIQEALSYLSQAADAIDYAHTRDIVHRDIKPGNMLLRTDGWLLLTDFGIARILSGYEQLTQAGVGFGTPEYMAPEQAQGKAVAASDNYSLAVLAYQLFTGRVPFNADSSYATTMQHIMMPPPPPRSINPSLSPAIEQALLHGLAKQPEQRPASARAFVGELQQAISGAPYEGTYIPNPILMPTGQQQTFPASTPGMGKIPESKKGLTRRQLLIGGSAVAVAAVGVGGIALWASSRKQTSVGPVATSTTTTGSAGSTPTSSAGAPILIQGKHNKPVGTLTWSPTANLLVSAGSSNDGNVYLWDVDAIAQQGGKTPKEKASLSCFAVTEMLVAWAPTGDMLAIANAEVKSTISSAKMVLYKSDFSGYALGLSDQIELPDATSFDSITWGKDYILTVHHPFSLSKGINLKTKDQVLLWDPKQPKKPLPPMEIDELAMYSSSNIVEVGSSKYANLATNPLSLAPVDNVLRFTIGTTKGIRMGDVTVTNNKPSWKKYGLFKFTEGDDYAPADVGAISWAKFGQHLAAIQQGLAKPKQIKIFDFETKLYDTFNIPPDSQAGLTTLTWSAKPASTMLAAGNKDGQVYIWDYKGAKLPQTTLNPPAGITDLVKALAWSPDGNWLAVGYNDKDATIALWKM